MIITFFGHSSVPFGRKVKKIVKDVILENAPDNELISFYLGGYGDFDEICASACRELRKEYDSIELVYVTPYMGLREQLKIGEMQRNGICDSSIYPPLEGVPLKLAILKRNEWMAKNSDLVIAYVRYNCGGAYKALQFSKRN